MEKYWDGENWLNIKKEDNIVQYFLNKELHRKDGPAFIQYMVFIKSPTMISNFDYYYDRNIISNEEYYINGKRHRENGPAIIYYYENGSVQIENYYFNNKLHRIDGPASLYYNFESKCILKSYWFNGTKFDPEELPFEMTIDTEEKKLFMKLKYGG